MALTDIFIRRPILAIVVSLLILLVGVSATFSLPVRQYPRMESATITIDTAFPGATQDVMQGFVTTPIAQAIATADRKSVEKGQSVSVRVDLGGRRAIRQKKHEEHTCKVTIEQN